MLVSQRIAQQADFGTGIGPVSPQFAQNPGDPLTDLEVLVSTGIGVLTVLGSLFFIVYFFLGAFKWMTAGGDASKVAKARDEMVQGVMGLIILVAAYGIIGLIGRIVGLNLLEPADTIRNLMPTWGAVG